jgi:predicted alpha/beta-hydrolase family hydrolase
VPHESRSITLDLGELGSVGARFDRAARPRSSAILLAHGAGLDMESPWMSAMASALVERGFDVLRFRYPYMQRAVGAGHPIPPDRTPVLEQAHEAALAELRRLCPQRRWLLAGKSLGGRIATHIAAKGADCAGLVLLGYPLHPPREPERERSEHFGTLAQPALFLQGTRDEFGTPQELARALRRYGGRATLSPIEGGNHSFELPAAAHEPLETVLGEVGQRVAAWDSATWPD